MGKIEKIGICVFCRRELGIDIRECVHYDSDTNTHIGPDGTVSRHITIKPKDMELFNKLLMKLKQRRGK